MPDLAIDVSYARPDPQAVKNAGYAAVLRYLSGGTPGKDLTAAEAAAWLAAGVDVGVVWETTAQRALDGAAVGTVDGHAAAAEAAQIGYPAGCVIFANVGDFAATPDQLAAIAAYLRAFAAETAAAGWPAGGYATRYIIDSLAGQGICSWWWQNAENDAGQSGSIVSPNTAIYQRVTPTRSIAGSTPSDFDEDVLITPVPLWGAPPPAAQPEPAPVTQPAAPAFGQTDLPGEPMRLLTAADVATDNLGNGWTDFDLAGSTVCGAPFALVADPGTPAPHPDGDRYDHAHCAITIGAAAGRQRVSIVDGCPNSHYSINLPVSP